jgi:hypothetical protein
LSDFHPKGRASRAEDLYNEERGASFRGTYEPGILPDPSEILAVIDALN